MGRGGRGGGGQGQGCEGRAWEHLCGDIRAAASASPPAQASGTASQEVGGEGRLLNAVRADGGQHALPVQAAHRPARRGFAKARRRKETDPTSSGE
jgi:hypothetical protein